MAAVTDSPAWFAEAMRDALAGGADMLEEQARQLRYAASNVRESVMANAEGQAAILDLTANGLDHTVILLRELRDVAVRYREICDL